jgi:pimeloyl-ACP methyl ester carboxylesterase
VTIGVTNTLPGLTNLLRVDQYTASMSNGQSNTSNLYLAASSNGRVVILNPGHQFTCDWTAFLPVYQVQPALQALLEAGYSVFAMNMPGCGIVAVHNALFASYGNAAMGYFIEPAIQAMNYWDANKSFADYNFVGFSGGGWTTVVIAALDPRIQISVQIAGSMPGIQFVGAHAAVDAEQDWAPFYTIAGYEDLYLMGSYEVGRKELQILITNDSADPCCFSSYEWNGTFGGLSYAAYYGQSWDQYIRLYLANILRTQASVGGDFDLVQDRVATAHQISSFARDMAIATLDNVSAALLSPPPSPPPQQVSPDGTMLTALSSGSLSTAAGTWTFARTQPQPGEYEIFLNGNYVTGGGYAAEMEVAHGGNLYAYNSDSRRWWVWNNGWSQSAAP